MNRAIYTGDLSSKEKTKLMTADSNGEYADPGYVLFHREATLFALPFDAKKRVRTGDPLHIADQVALSSMNGRGVFDVSQNGALVYLQSGGGRSGGFGRGQTAGNWQWGWQDRRGGSVTPAGETDTYGDMA